MNKTNKIPNYLIKIIKEYPKITSGRKDYIFFNQRILKNIELTKKFMKKIKI